jgi:integrase
MRPDANGSLRPLADGWEARITIRGRHRVGLVLPFSRVQEAEARERCTLLAGLARRLRKAGLFEDAPKLLEIAANATTASELGKAIGAIETLCTPGVTEPGRKGAMPTFKEFGEQWTKGQLHKKWPDYVKEKRSAEDDRVRLEKHVYPIVGDIELNRFDVRHAEAVMASLPSNLSASTRRQVAQLIHRLLAMAVYPARHILTNPLPRGFLPKPSKQKAWPILYPKEDAQLMACAAIWLGRRLFYGWLHREGSRMGEAVSLRWRDLDLKHGTVRLDANKTEEPRTWVLDHGVFQALKRFKQPIAPQRSRTNSCSPKRTAVPSTPSTWRTASETISRRPRSSRDAPSSSSARRRAAGLVRTAFDVPSSRSPWRTARRRRGLPTARTTSQA